MKLFDITVHMLETDPGRCALTLLQVKRRLQELDELPLTAWCILEAIAHAFGEEGPTAEYMRLSCAAGLLQSALSHYRAKL
jgi:hypothetical protein